MIDTVDSKRMSPRSLSWQSNFFSRMLPLLVLFAALSFTYILWSAERHNAEQDLTSEFDLQAQAAMERIDQRVHACEQMLHAVRAQFSNHDEVTRETFRIYVNSLSLPQHFPGVQDVGFLPLVPAAEKIRHSEKVRRDGFPEYAISPEGGRELYAPILYLESFSGNNLRSLGFDHYSEAIRREGMEKARDLDAAIVTGKVKLAAGDEKISPSVFLMNLPLYRYGMPHATLGERRANLTGWVSAAFRVDDLITAALGKLESGLDIEVYDGDRTDRDSLMYDNDKIPSYTIPVSLHQHTGKLKVGDHVWTVVIRSLPGFEARLDQKGTMMVLLAGAPLSLLLGVLTWLLLLRRNEAVLARDELEISRARLQATLDNSPFMIWQKDVEGRYITFNQAFLAATGKSHPDEIIGHTDFDIWPSDLAEKYRTDDAAVMQAHQQKVAEEQTGKEGEPRFWVETCKTPILDSKGRLLGTTGFAQDITQRKLSTEALRQSEARFRQLFNGSIDAIYVIDPANWKFIESNDIGSRRLSYSHEELLNLSLVDINAPGQVDADIMVKRINEDGYAMFECVHLARDGRKIPVEISAHLVEFDGKPAILAVTRDISERKRIDTEYRTLIQTTPDGFWLVSAQNGRLADVNSAYCDMTGYSREELLDKPVSMVEAEHDEKKIAQNIQAILRGEALRFESRHRHKDGHLIDVEISSRYLDARGGMIVAFIRDITERVRVETALKQSEERLAIATRAGIIGVWDWNVVNNQLFWDDAMYRLYGISAGDFGGAYEAWFSTIHPEDKQRVEGEVQAALRGEREYAPEFRVIWPDGSLNYLKAASHTLFDANGKPLRMVGINYDITQQKLSTQIIDELLEFNSTIISESTLGMVVYQGGGECVLVNEAAARIVGATREQVLAQNFRKIKSWQASGMLDAALLTLESGKNQHVEANLVTSFGKQIWIVCDFVKLIRGGEPHLLLILNDVSEFRRAELALSAAKLEAENANRAKSEFLANMSHEIRTPMHAIIGLSELAIGSGELTPKLRNYLNKVNTSSKALLSILNDILDYSKVEAGRLELDQTELRLETLLDNVADLFNVRADEKGIELVLDIAPDVPGYVIGDPLRLGQVMNNLVGNAVKFTEKGEIVIKVKLLSLNGGVSTLHFSVRDTGIGMSEEHVSRLFQAFTQADSSITRRFGGTGLGLTISKKLVEKMGGDISVSSAPGQGSTFSFTIRMAVSNQAHIERSPAELRGMRVLVVDDLDTSRQFLHEQLKAWQFQVTEASSGQEALELIEQHMHDQFFELVLLDWKMPGMDGLEVARRIRELVKSAGANRKLPVIIMVTAYSKEQLMQEAQDIHLDALLNKPVTSSGLFDAIMKFQGGYTSRHGLAATGEICAESSAIRGARILLVEDNETNQLVAVDFLERMGFDVTVANHGQEALEKLDGADFDAVLMDVQMPVMNGYEATQRIRQRWRDLPVIAMTAAVMAEDRAACIAAGMNDHVSKPILPQELLRTLLRWIRPEHESYELRPSSAALPELPGFDSQAALELLGGNRSLYFELLRKFSQEFADASFMLSQLDRQDAAALAHRINGAAANLGAIELHHAADTLEQALIAGAPLSMSAFDGALTETMNTISHLSKLPETMSAQVEYNCEKCNWQQAALLIKQIRELVEGFEFVPFELLTELKGLVACMSFQMCIHELEQHLDKTDYGKARQVLDNLPCIAGHDFKGCNNAQ